MKDKYSAFLSLKRELEGYVAQGIDISLEGQSATPLFVAMICTFCENVNYMRDYILDDDYRIIEVRFNKIRLY